MASPIHDIHTRGERLSRGGAWGGSEDDEPATVRSAPAPLAESGEVLCAAADRHEVEVDFEVEVEEECPETLRSPVSEGVSTCSGRASPERCIRAPGSSCCAAW
jgi:hypothetical protein